jgi:hypothetical protein
VIVGTKVTATLWVVFFRHRDPDAAPDAPDPYKAGHLHLLTADPSGRDLFEVAEAAVLNGRARPELEFSIVKAERACEVKGTGVVAGGRN